ncbi:MAG TPA: hypothetical protein VF865_21360 [Acidobacteriaceae bacterium]
MDRNEFRHALRLGLGRAILYAAEGDTTPFRDVILDACLHCYAIDPQCEGTRADYMFDLIDLLPDKDSYIDATLKSLADSADDWDTRQRFRLAARWAMQGNDEAKRAMYAAYRLGPEAAESVGIEFLHLDGLQGLLFVTEQIGRLLIANTRNVDLGWLMSVSTDLFGQQVISETLREAGAQNQFIKAYRKAVEAPHSSSKPQDDSWINCATYGQIRERLSKGTSTGFGHQLGRWGEKASDDDFQRAAYALESSTDEQIQIGHLRIFSKRAFPLDVGILFRLAESGRNRQLYAALKALAQITNPAVRNFAFESIRLSLPARSYAIKLLSKNYKAGDHATALKWFDDEHKQETLHSWGMDLLDFWNHHPEDASRVRMLLEVYERGPCSFCRERVIADLIELNSLTENMAAECNWDANDETRELVGRATLGSAH